MFLPTRSLPLAALVGALLLVPAPAGAKEPPKIPAAIAVPAGHKLYMRAHAVGVQIYACDGTAWSFVAPRAKLTAGKDKLTHFAGPTWKHRDGSTVVGQVVANAPRKRTIPWLLLSTTATERGKIAKTTYIQRINTTGGLMPDARLCTPSTAGTQREVRYTADYLFWKKR
jgi:hypothetical protein